MVFFLARPNLVARHRLANFKLHNVSGPQTCVGLTHNIMITLELPLNELLNKWVNLESRNGTCPPPPDLPRAQMTLPKAERLLLMLCASFNRSPVADVLEMRSLPAKSIMCKRLTRCLALDVGGGEACPSFSPYSPSSPSSSSSGLLQDSATMVTVITKWDREECALKS